MTQTLIIPESLIRQETDLEEVLQAERDAMVAMAEGDVTMPEKMYMAFPEGDLRLMPSHLHSAGAAGVKLVTVHPHNAAKGEYPTVMATYVLLDPATGFPLAVMGASWLTALRTGAASALATQALANPDASVLAIVGAGVQAHTQILFHLMVMPNLQEVHVYGLNPEALLKYREEHFSTLQAQGVSLVTHTQNLGEVLRGADVIVTVTPARNPVVLDRMVKPGTHINAVGADAPGKQELDLALLKRARIFVDEWEQAAHSGEINVAVLKGQIKKEDIAGSLPMVLAKKAQGRWNEEEITVFDSTGLAVQDAALAHGFFTRLKDHPQVLKANLVS